MPTYKFTGVQYAQLHPLISLIDVIIRSGCENVHLCPFIFLREFLPYIMDAIDYLIRRKYVN